MTIAVVDDSQEIRAQISALINDYSDSHDLDISAVTFETAEDILAGYRPYHYSAIFLDIFMDSGISGLEAAERIRQVDRNVMIVFLTSSEDHRPEAFRFHAYEYITKPVTQERLFSVLGDMFHHQTGEDVRKFFFNRGRHRVGLPVNEIVSIQASAHYLEIVDADNNVYRTRMTFSDAVNTLSDEHCFLQLIRGVLVNMQYIIGFSSNSCTLVSGDHLPINVRNAAALENTWRNFKFSNIREAAMRRNP